MNDSQKEEKKRRTSKPTNSPWFKTKDLCRLFGVYESTIKSWEQTGKIKAIRTPSGVRLFDKQSILAYFDQASQAPSQKKNLIYCRVSSPHQKDDLQRQIDHLRSQYPDHQLVQDIGSGINFKRKGLQTILELALKGDLGQLVVSYKDRLARFGFELIEWIIDKQGGQVVVLDSSSDQSTEQELAQDLLSIVTVFNARNMAKRRYKKNSPHTIDQIED
ncbi:MAG: IS607 family transposase [Candidatus Hodarchaeales archaeon]|jgi:predicted site-specific integrase-resolvase